MSFCVAGVALRHISPSFKTCQTWFCVAGAILLRRFHKMCCMKNDGRRSILKTSDVILRAAGAALSTCRVACLLRIALSGLRDVVTPTRTHHSTLYTLHSTLRSLLQAQFHTSHSTLYTPHLQLYTTLRTFHFTLHTLHLYTSHFTLYTPHLILHTLHITPFTPHSTLYTPHFTSHTLHFTLHT